MIHLPLDRQHFLRCFVIAGFLSLARVVEKAGTAEAAEPSPDKEYLGVFRRGSQKNIFAVIEKPLGVPVGKGTNVEIDAHGLRVEKIYLATAGAFFKRHPELASKKSHNLPPDFKVYSDNRYVEPSYAGGSRKYKIKFIDPSDVTGVGGPGRRGGGLGGPAQ